MTTSAFLIDGEVVPAERAVVSVLDRGFLYGDGVYEVLRTIGGRPVDRDRHLARLAASAARIGLALPPIASLVAWSESVLAAIGLPDVYLRVVVTRGDGPVSLDPAIADGPRTVMIALPLQPPTPAQYRDGVALVVSQVERVSPRALDPAIKSGNYLNNVLALGDAKRRGAYEAIMLNAAGEVAEGSTSNLFVVVEGRLATPSLDAGILAGITRGRVLELATAAGLAPIERAISRADLAAASEAFLTSSIRGVLGVASIDGRALARGAFSARLIAAYDGFLAEIAAGRHPA